MNSKILNTIHDSVKSLHEAEIVDSTTMHKFDSLCLDPAKPISKTAIKKFRHRNFQLPITV